MMQELSVIVSLAVVAEALVEYTTFKLPKHMFPSWMKLYAGMAVGVALCLIYNGDLMLLLGLQGVPIIGPVITGLLIGRGSNVANDLFKRLRLIQVPAARVDRVDEQGVVAPPTGGLRPDKGNGAAEHARSPKQPAPTKSDEVRL
jgi:hypothetical protein